MCIHRIWTYSISLKVLLDFWMWAVNIKNLVDYLVLQQNCQLRLQNRIAIKNLSWKWEATFSQDSFYLGNCADSVWLNEFIRSHDLSQLICFHLLCVVMIRPTVIELTVDLFWKVFAQSVSRLVQRMNNNVTDESIPHGLTTARTPQKSSSLGGASHLKQGKDKINILITNRKFAKLQRIKEESICLFTVCMKVAGLSYNVMKWRRCLSQLYILCSHRAQTTGLKLGPSNNHVTVKQECIVNYVLRKTYFPGIMFF